MHIHVHVCSFVEFPWLPSDIDKIDDPVKRGAVISFIHNFGQMPKQVCMRHDMSTHPLAVHLTMHRASRHSAWLAYLNVWLNAHNARTYMCVFLVFVSSICLLLDPSSIYMYTLALSLLPSAVPSHSSSRSLTQVARFSPSPLILPSPHPLLSWIPGEYSTKIYPN